MKTYLSLLLTLCLATVAQAENKLYKGFGISFVHDDDITVAGKVSGVPTITAKDGKGIQCMIQDYGKAVAPGKLSDMMVNQLMKVFKGEITELTNKTVNRPLFGAKREGRYLVIVKQGIPIEAVVFTFEHAGKTWCVITQQAMKDTAKAEKYFAKIQASLKVQVEPNAE